MRVPEFSGPDVSPSGMPTPYNGNRTSPETFGGGLAQPLNAVGGELAGFMGRARERATADRVSKADADFGNAIIKAQHDPGSETDAMGQPTGEPKGFLLKLGQNAVDPSKHLQDIEDLRNNAINDLADNAEAQRQFTIRSAGRLEHARQLAEVHSGQQMRAVSLEAANAQQKLAIDSAGLAMGTPDEVRMQADQAVGAAMGPLIHHMQFNEGAPTDAIRAKVTDFQSRVYGKALQTFIDQRHGADARELYEKVKDKLGAQAPEYEKLVIKAERQQSGGVYAGQAVKEATGQGGFVDMQKGIAWLDDHLKDDDERKGPALEAFNSRAGLYNKAAKEREDQALGRIWQDIEHHGGTLNEASADFQGLSDEAKGRAVEKAKGIQRQLMGDVRRDAADERRAAAEARAEQGRADKLHEDQFSAIQDPAEQANANIGQLYPDASPDAVARMGIIQKKAAAQLNKDKGVARAEFNSFVKNQSDSVLGSKELRDAFGGVMQRWYMGQDKEPSKEDVLKKIGEELTLEQGRLWGTGKYNFQHEIEGETPRAAAAPEKQKYSPNKTQNQPKPQQTGMLNGKPYAKGPDGKWHPLQQQ